MYDHILIPVDGSDAATRAASVGLGLAAASDATVDVLYVVERRMLRRAPSAAEKDDLRERGEAVLAEIAALAENRGQSVETAIEQGRPADAICEHAADRDADLVVMGRHGRRSLGERVLGGVTERVLRHGDAPVLVVPEADAPPSDEYDRVLVPTDGSENAEAATDHGAAIAELYGSTVDVLSVVDVQAAGGVFNAGGLSEEFVERLEAEGREATRRAADEIREAVPDAAVETAVVRGKPGAEIAAYAADRDVDLVAMGSHGRSNLGRQLLGSVTSEVVRAVDVPVLVVKRGS